MDITKWIIFGLSVIAQSYGQPLIDGYNEVLDIDYSVLLPTVEHGLTHNDKPHKRVIIVGAGIAGLVAADLLKNAGHQVKILEVSDRIGGRIDTYRDANYGWHGDLGGMSYYTNHYILNYFIEKFQLKTAPFVTDDPNTFYYYNGIKTTSFNNTQSLFNFPGMTREEREIALKYGKMGLLSWAVRPIHEDYLKHNWSYIVQKYDHYDIKEFLRSRLSQGSVNMLQAVTNSNGFYSILQLVRFMFNALFPDDLVKDEVILRRQLVDGMHAVVKGFSKHFQEDIILNANVSSVVQQSMSENRRHKNDKVNNIIPHFKNEILNKLFRIENEKRRKDNNAAYTKTSPVEVSYINTKTGATETVNGDIVLMTPTAPAMKQIKFEPDLSHEKRHALNIHYVNANKVFLYFSEPFWHQDGIYTGGVSHTDLHIRTVYYPNYNDSIQASVLLVYTDWYESEYWDDMSSDEMIQRALQQIEYLHNRDLQDIFINGQIKRWKFDPYSLSGYAAFLPNQETLFYPAIAKAEGNIHFAGEHTSLMHGWIEGSVVSAVKAAIEIHAA